MRPATVDRRGRHFSRFSRSRSASCGALSRTRRDELVDHLVEDHRELPVVHGKADLCHPSPHALERRRRADARTGQPCTRGGAGISSSQSDQSRNARTATGSPGRRPTATTPVALVGEKRDAREGPVET
jgi:hypothetical protein